MTSISEPPRRKEQANERTCACDHAHDAIEPDRAYAGAKLADPCFK